ncbi:MAG: hypothetical protein IPN08_00010 [Bacteroidales bacterium]|nr:hypothetical protein [Bacteroidales bacterium]
MQSGFHQINQSYRFIDGKYYISKKIDTIGQKSLLFVEFLIDGVVDIYYYRTSTVDNYLIDKGDGKLILLDNKDKLVMVDDRQFVRHNKPYVGVLKYIFMSSPSVSKQVENISLDHKSLITLARVHAEVYRKDALFMKKT